jgi:hypothetical protein
MLDYKDIDFSIVCHWKQKPLGKILQKISMKHTHQQKSLWNILQKIRDPPLLELS